MFDHCNTWQRRCCSVRAEKRLALNNTFRGEQAKQAFSKTTPSGTASHIFIIPYLQKKLQCYLPTNPSSPLSNAFIHNFFLSLSLSLSLSLLFSSCFLLFFFLSSTFFLLSFFLFSSSFFFHPSLFVLKSIFLLFFFFFFFFLWSLN